MNTIMLNIMTWPRVYTHLWTYMDATIADGRIKSRLSQRGGEGRFDLQWNF